ncbi:hypothetical protein [Lichenifustis flavocetrariae]|uniref:Uncharacterized protein n=1 Tax=Lichenifustis flavocetrariae TaxID=2949735 RepID=A0AA42CLU2_9HYPH|nr:hypothetical protein [Lichenifustis flavocetrariae]MCW6507742.1 hypothetical protein [Lichenifustis flavocetrariae]
MYQRVITAPQMSEVFEELQYTGTIHEGSVWVTMGHHPELGSVVTIQDDSPDKAVLHSEFPPDFPSQEPADGKARH